MNQSEPVPANVVGGCLFSVIGAIVCSMLGLGVGLCFLSVGKAFGVSLICFVVGMVFGFAIGAKLGNIVENEEPKCKECGHPVSECHNCV